MNRIPKPSGLIVLSFALVIAAPSCSGSGGAGGGGDTRDPIAALDAALSGQPTPMSIADGKLLQAQLSEMELQYLDYMSWQGVEAAAALADPTLQKAMLLLASNTPYYTAESTAATTPTSRPLAQPSGENLATLAARVEKLKQKLAALNASRAGRPTATAVIARAMMDVWRDENGEPLDLPSVVDPADPGHWQCSVEFHQNHTQSESCEYAPFCSVSVIDWNTGERTCLGADSGSFDAGADANPEGGTQTPQTATYDIDGANSAASAVLCQWWNSPGVLRAAASFSPSPGTLGPGVSVIIGTLDATTTSLTGSVPTTLELWATEVYSNGSCDYNSNPPASWNAPMGSGSASLTAGAIELDDYGDQVRVLDITFQGVLGGWVPGTANHPCVKPTVSVSGQIRCRISWPPTT